MIKYEKVVYCYKDHKFYGTSFIVLETGRSWVSATMEMGTSEYVIHQIRRGCSTAYNSIM